jgi:hypothetical protein
MKMIGGGLHCPAIIECLTEDTIFTYYDQADCDMQDSINVLCQQLTGYGDATAISCNCE